MSIYKNTDLEFSLQQGTEKGGVYTNFYTEDKGSASIRIRLSSNEYYLDLTKIDLKPVLFLFHEDGSIFEIKDFINVMPDKGLIQYNLSDNVIAHAGKVKAKLFLKNTKQSVHVANFTFDIKDSGIEGAVAKEISVNIVDDAVRRIVKENAMELLDDEYKEKINQDIIEYVASNPDKYRGQDGKGLNYSDLTTQQKEELRSNITNQAVTDYVIPDSSITDNKIADNSITPNKTTFIKESVNLFDINNTYEGKIANTSNGNIETKNNWYVTGLIKVTHGVNYARNKNAEIVAFDENENYYGSYGNSTEIVKFAKDVKYVRLNIESKNIQDFQFEQNDKSTEYSPFGATSENLKVTNKNLTNNSVNTSNIVDSSITKNKTDFIVESDNLFNNQNLVFNKKLSDVNTITDDITYVISDYIEVIPSETYGTNDKYYGYVLYDANKNYITGRGQYTDNVTIPDKVKYIRLSILNKWLPGFKFYNVKSTNVGPYNLGIKNQPLITEDLTNGFSFNKQTFVKDKLYNDYEVIDVLHDSDILATTSRVLEDYRKLYKSNTIAYSMDSLGKSSSEVRLTPRSVVDLMGSQEILLTIYIEDVTQIKNITINIPKEGGGSWERSATDLKNGWNRIRLFANEGDLDNWTQARMFRIIMYTKDTLQATITISDFKLIKPKKAKLIMVNDHGYSNYKKIAHERFKKLGIPTTFAINPGRLGTPIPGASSILSQEEINELAVDPYAEFSYHAWNPTEKASANMTPEEIKQELAQCKHYLKLNGIYPDFFWRAAFVQNKAPNHDAINEDIEAYAQFDESSRFDAFPFKTTYGINRKQLHNIDSNTIDTFFDILEKTHCLVVFYTHDISDDGGIHMTTSELDYFESKLKIAIEEGWLEPTTYSKLRRKYQTDKGTNFQKDFYENI